VGSGQWAVGIEEVKTNHHPLPATHFDLERVIVAEYARL